MADAPLCSPGEPPRARLAPALALIGTLVLCAAAMMGHLSPVQMKSAASVVWVIGFLTQASAFLLALAKRHAE